MRQALVDAIEQVETTKEFHFVLRTLAARATIRHDQHHGDNSPHEKHRRERWARARDHITHAADLLA
jgi:hypothetical protein